MSNENHVRRDEHYPYVFSSFTPSEAPAQVSIHSYEDRLALR